MLFTSTVTIFYTVADLAVLINLITKLNGLNIDCQGKNYWRHRVFQNKPKVAKHSIKERCANLLPKCSKPHWSHDVSILCVMVMLNNEFQIRFKGFEPANFALSFITNLFEERMDGSENDKFIFSVFKKNVCELDLETSNFHLDLSLET